MSRSDFFEISMIANPISLSSHRRKEKTMLAEPMTTTIAVTNARPSVVEHPRTRAEREKVRNLGDAFEYRPDTRDARFVVEDMTIGMFGQDKSGGPDQGRGMFGQDMAFMDTIVEDDFHAMIGAIADGHGHEGEIASSMAIDCLRIDIFRPSRLRELLRLIMAREETEIRNMITRIFAEMDRRVCERTTTGGSTLTTWIFFHGHADGRVFLLTANVGDSPLMVIRTQDGRVGEMTTPHSWDSIQEREAHIRACHAAGHPVPDVIYSRWNTSNCSIRFRTRDGNTDEPIRMFAGPTAVLDEANRAHVINELARRGVLPGGRHTRRRMLQMTRLDSDPWEEEVVPEHGHENHGSTPLEIDGSFQYGGPQMSRSIGDSRYKNPSHDGIPYMTATPSISLLEFSEPMHLALIACSDGPGDALYQSEFGEETRNYFASTTTTTSFSDHLRDAVMREGVPFFGKAAWDDLSLICASFVIRTQP